MVRDFKDVHQRVQRFLRWIRKNVRRGSIVQIGAHYRKVISVNQRGVLTLRKISSNGYPGDTTTYCLHDYYRKFKGIVHQRRTT